MKRFLNHYRCSGSDSSSHKETGWEDESSSTNNDECPVCLAEIEPYESDDVPAEEFDHADIVIRVDGGIVSLVKAPPGMTVLVRDYDVEGGDGDDMYRDDDDEECIPIWLNEPGEANAAEVPAPERAP